MNGFQWFILWAIGAVTIVLYGFWEIETEKSNIRHMLLSGWFLVFLVGIFILSFREGIC